MKLKDLFVPDRKLLLGRPYHSAFEVNWKATEDGIVLQLGKKVLTSGFDEFEAEEGKGAYSTLIDIVLVNDALQSECPVAISAEHRTWMQVTITPQPQGASILSHFTDMSNDVIDLRPFHMYFQTPEQANRDQVLEVDKSLNEEQLGFKYNSYGGGRHPIFKEEEWRSAVAQGDTLLGYWDWVAGEIEQAIDQSQPG